MAGMTRQLNESLNGVRSRNGIPYGLLAHQCSEENFANYELGDAVDWQKCTYKPDETDFDTSKAIVEGTKEYEYVMLTIKTLAEELKKGTGCRRADYFPSVSRSRGQHQYQRFWFSGSGGARAVQEKFDKKLWKQLYTTLTEEYGIHNLIWEQQQL